MRGNKFKFDSLQFLLKGSHKINFKRGGSYVDSLDWIKKKKATINPIKKDDECIQYDAAIVLSYEKNERKPQIISNLLPFKIRCNRDKVKYSSGKNEFCRFCEK